MNNSGVKIEAHLIQNFAPSNLNRDDTGQPKSATFGGFRRARVSSQCSKRSTRREGPMSELLEQCGAFRTRQLIVEIAKGIDKKDKPDDKTLAVVTSVFEAGGLEKSGEASKNTTKILVFLDKEALPKLVGVFRENWEDLTKENKKTQETSRDRVGQTLFEAVKAPDIALFGRMLELKDSTPFGKYNMRVEAACQVAHPLSTHKVDMEMDFYTAVDDLNPEEETGAGMMGIIGFNSACYYRYALVDRDQLARNLARKTERKNGQWVQNLTQEDYTEADKVIEAFLEAMVYAIPTGKQNSFAAQNLPSFGLFVRRQGGVPISLANAFAKPVRPTKNDDDLVGLSVDALTKHWDTLQKVYGEQGVQTTSYFHIEQEGRLKKKDEKENEYMWLRSDRKSVKKAIEAVLEVGGQP
jgi:CRISPR system Cascade subunit CasC